MQTLAAGADNTQFEDSMLNIIIYENNYNQKIDYYLQIIDYYKDINLKTALKYTNTAAKIAADNHLAKQEFQILLKKVVILSFLGNQDSVTQVISILEQKAKKIKDTDLIGQFHLTKGTAYNISNDYVNAMDNCLQAIPLLEKSNDSLSLAKTYNLMGIIYDITGNSQKALENYLLSADFVEPLNNQQMLGGINNNIGVIYDLLGNKKTALTYYYKSLKYYNKTNNQRGITNAFINIASLLADQKRYDEALIYSRKAELINNKTNSIISNATIYETFGEIFLNLNKFDSAYYYFNKSLIINNKLQNQLGIAQAYNLLGKFYRQKQQYKPAIACFEKAKTIAEESDFLDISENALSNLSELHAALGQFENAYNYQSKVLAIADSLREVSRKEEIKHSELQFAFRNQNNIHKQQLTKFEQEHVADMKKQTMERLVFGVFFTIIFVIGFFLYRSSQKLQRFNHKLLLQNREIEDQKELIEISNIELKEQYTFTETLLNTIPNPVFYTDKNNVLLGCNNAFEKISGKLVDDLVGINLGEINVKTNISCDTGKLFGNPGKDLIRNEGNMIYDKGIEHDVICFRKGIVNASDKLLGILGIIIDVTDIRKVEKDLIRSQSRLKDVISAKDKFFNIMAHDLKNPFNAILGLTNLMTEDYDSHTQDEIKQYIKLINQSATHIYNLLENLLEWARTQSGIISKSPQLFPVNDTIQECINLFHQNIKLKEIRVNFNVSQNYMVFADKNMVMTVIRNLLSNAIKYSEVSSSIDIKLEKHADKLNIHVKDYGVGIAQDNLDKLFKLDQPFTTTGVLKEKGTGLGLMISKEFVKINNGSLKVKSKIDKGSVFTVTLPTTIR